MAVIEKTERMLNLVSYLLKRVEPVPWSEIVGQVVGYDDDEVTPEAIERRFQRDKRDLRKMGLPLEYIPGDPADPDSGGYILERDQFFLQELDLTPGESHVLNLVSQLVVRFSDEIASDYFDDLRSALRKVQFDNPEAFGASPASPEYRPGLYEVQRDDRMLRNLEVLSEAVLLRRRVRFTYWSIGRDKVKRRRVDPYGLGCQAGNWYLVGRCRTRKGRRMFRVDRIRGNVSMQGKKGAFRPPGDFRMGDFIQRPIWELGKSGYQAVIRLSPDIAWSIGELLGDVEVVEESPSGERLLRIQVRDERGFLRWAMRRLRHLEVVEPEELKQLLDQEVEKTLAPYLE